MRFRLLLIAGLLLLATGALFAQGFGNRMGGGSTTTVMVSSPKGIFALRSGVLVKFNAATLKQELIQQLFGPMPEQPKDFTDRTKTQAYFAEMQKRQAPALMLVSDNSLLIIIGDGFARVNQDTLAVEKTLDLRPPAPAATDPATPTTPGTTTPPGAPNPGGGTTRQTQEPVPGYLLTGNTLVLMRGAEILSINITEGKIIAREPLSKELQPAQFNFQFGRGGAGGGAGAGAAGGDAGGRTNRGGGDRGTRPGGGDQPGTTPAEGQ